MTGIYVYACHMTTYDVYLTYTRHMSYDIECHVTGMCMSDIRHVPRIDIYQVYIYDRYDSCSNIYLTYDRHLTFLF
jgi:hypothetical protein